MYLTVFYLMYLFIFIKFFKLKMQNSCSFGVKSGEIKMLLICSVLSLLRCFEMFVRMEIFSDLDDIAILSSLGSSRCLATMMKSFGYWKGDTSKYY